MKTLFLTFALVLTSLFSFSQDSGVTLTLTIDNVISDKGNVKMALHTVDTFMKGKGLENGQSEIKDGKVTITFENVKPGDYAVIAFHDENENNKMDFRDNGMPLESYGMSNNVMSFGPPQYEDAKFTIADKDLELNIRF
ncbi:uncharacterized protein (DUF2141 family) [Winogradskyella eximia]|jgi:uncharacterized protein (DUF2141 family)|uniref:Uncharacterized protein (DUF2141 family) n=1 Tax=Winogradskyella eximia TaxID=262006 RepID=A0A3D9H287_9FLAO|nr:DUF2141 domain-containing protein [Winogradskyella eximia]RED43006.1 uncharacterized protein (DUF2141 family) [Winogradskyella eximia]|tara:strand:+ start:295 stop:711 length:417 start_codon:yes stop_codon:yes gene_type:complete